MTAPEFELLLASARTVPDSGRIQQLVQQSIDWKRLWALATRHSVRPLVCRSLETVCWSEVPEPSQQEMREAVRAIGGKNLFLAGELIRVVQTLESAGIRVWVLKGLLFGEILYGDIRLRETNDFDLLIREEDVRRVVRVFQELGYTTRPGENLEQLTALLRYVGEYTFMGGEKLVDIDLHWRFSNRALALAPEFSDFPLSPRSYSLVGSAVQSIAIEEQPLYLAAQGGNDFWSDLRRVCDVAEYLRRFPETDWSPIVAAARKRRAESILLTGLQLAASLFGAPLPEGLDGEIQRSELTGKLAAEVAHRMQQQEEPGLFERHVFQVQAKEGALEKVKLFWALLTDRMMADAKWIRLPRFLWGLYRMLRPIRMVVKMGKAE